MEEWVESYPFDTSTPLTRFDRVMMVVGAPLCARAGDRHWVGYWHHGLVHRDNVTDVQSRYTSEDHMHSRTSGFGLMGHDCGANSRSGTLKRGRDGSQAKRPLAHSAPLALWTNRAEYLFATTRVWPTGRHGGGDTVDRRHEEGGARRSTVGSLVSANGLSDCRPQQLEQQIRSL